MLGYITKTIRADMPIEQLVQIQAKPKCLMLQILNRKQINSNFAFVNSVTDNNCGKNILPYVNKNSLQKWKTQETWVCIYLFIYIYLDLYTVH